MSFMDILIKTDNFLWGIPLTVLILSAGLYLSVRLGFLQIKNLPKALKFAMEKEGEGSGEVSPFAALCTSLSATIGTGNIVGVASAIALGGPGALFWMELAAFLGMATKYTEGLLAVKYREVSDDGMVFGGPFYYIEKGMGKKFRWLARLFAFFGAVAGLFGIGTITQINSITSTLNDFFYSTNSKMAEAGGTSASPVTIISGLLVTLLAAAVILGGTKRIARVSEVLVPFMSCVYVSCVLILVIGNADKLPSALILILKSAFCPEALFGAGTGITLKKAVQQGISGGLFTNEAGLGSSPIADAAAKTNEPARQGLISMTGTFIDTTVICTLTGLSIILTGTYKEAMSGDLIGAEITAEAFERGLPFGDRVSSFILTACLVFFAFSTIIGWSCYGEKCLSYLAGNRQEAVFVYRLIYISAVFAGPYLTVSAVWTIADILNGLMALPNLIALFALSERAAGETERYFKKMRGSPR